MSKIVLTKEEKILVIEKALHSVRVSSNVWSYICPKASVVISSLRNEEDVSNDEVLEIIPELANKKPKYSYTDTIWFPDGEEGKQSRIKLLEELLTELKA